jgi:hypothetical protein
MYGLGMFGALVYCWQQADSFWEYRLSIFQGSFWVYEVFETPHRLNGGRGGGLDA